MTSHLWPFSLNCMRLAIACNAFCAAYWSLSSVDQGRYSEASATLEIAWPICSKFSSGYFEKMFARLPEGKVKKNAVVAKACFGKYERLLRLKTLWEACASLAEQDRDLDAANTDQLVRQYRSKAEDIREESEMAYQAGLGYIKQSTMYQSDPGQVARDIFREYLIDQFKNGYGPWRSEFDGFGECMAPIEPHRSNRSPSIDGNRCAVRFGIELNITF